MSRSTVAGLQSALRLYESDKVRERTDGQNRIREIFSNRENLLAFQENASRGGGAGWIALFQCLFQAVITEKKTWLRKSAGAQAERRLSDSISLVRWMAERSIPYISRNPLIALVTHMVHLLVYGNAVFQPAALDYAKALRALLSYPPHLETLDQQTWRALMGICWSALLGDEASVDGIWGEEDSDDQISVTGPHLVNGNNEKGRNPVISQASTELANLIPILLSSSGVTLVPPFPPDDGTYRYEISLGLSIINKVVRFIESYPLETGSHLPILRATNMVLSELEMNRRSDLVEGGTRLLPHLVSLWTTRNKAIREQVLISFRMLLPFLTHKTSWEKDTTGVSRASFERLSAVLEKETSSRWGFEPLDMGAVRLRIERRDDCENDWPRPFELKSMTAGFDFTHEQALRWSVLELYSECYFHLYQTHRSAGVTGHNETKAKRRKISDPVTVLIQSLQAGSILARSHIIQVFVFLIDRHWAEFTQETQESLGKAITTLLDDDHSVLQEWALIAWATIASSPKSQPKQALQSDAPGLSAHESTEADATLVWSHAMRKLVNPAVSRAAAHTAVAFLTFNIIDTTSIVRDLGILLQGVDIQGPPYPHDSVCALLSSALKISRQDVRLYSINLEDKLISYIAKWNYLDGTRGKGRMDQHTPADILALLNNICHLEHHPLAHPSTSDFLPDCAIVTQSLEEYRTRAIRQYNLSGTIPDAASSKTLDSPNLNKPESVITMSQPEGRVRRLIEILDTMVKTLVVDWPQPTDRSEARPALPPERCRRTIDLVVLMLAFHATLYLNGIRSENQQQSTLTLIELIVPHIRYMSYEITARHMIWKGFEPLIHCGKQSASTWPILLRPNSQSGIRQDLLPIQDTAADTSGCDPLQRAIWNHIDCHFALKSLLESCLDLIDGTESLQQSNIIQHTQLAGQEDDDFGEIRTAETDAMPLSKEAVECQRITGSLLGCLARLRLRGAALQSPSGNPPRDIELINTFLQADGQRMIHLGATICDCLEADLIRLSVKAVASIFSMLRETSTSYAYRNDESLLALVLKFSLSTAHIWLAPENGDTGLVDRILYTAKHLQLRSVNGQLPSWKVRLALLEFVDEYLDYDPDMIAWNNVSPSSMDVDQAEVGATDVISGALVDIDMRLRIRAATSTAGLLYLTSIPTEQHGPFYHSTVNSLPRETRHWDSFITDILWKLNCCIASPQLRAATIYHLYEISPSTQEYDHHLQIGLETVARRLGLPGIAPLYLAHAPLVVSSQICTQQSPMQIPTKLYGYSDVKSFAAATLQNAAPAILIDALSLDQLGVPSRRLLAREVYRDLCMAASAGEDETTAAHLPSTAAWALTVTPSGLMESSDDTLSRPLAVQRLGELPSINKSSDIIGVLTPSADEIATCTISLLECHLTSEEIATILEARPGETRAGANTYTSLMSGDGFVHSDTPPLVPSAGAQDVLETLDFLRKTFPSLSPSKVLFNTLIWTFYRVNQDFLVNEQYRHMRTICLVVSIYQDNLTHPTILGLLLREALSLLPAMSIGHIALGLLKFGFGLVRKTPSPPEDLAELLIGFGDMYKLLEGNHNVIAISAFEEWISESVFTWQKLDSVRPALEVAKATWPDRLTQYLPPLADHSVIPLLQQARLMKNMDILPICTTLIKSVTEVGVADDFKSAFWLFKEYLDPVQGPAVSAFIDLLYATHGQVHPPAPGAVKSPRDNPLASLRTRPKEDPSPYLRSAILQEIVSLTLHKDFQARSVALQMLQALIPHIGDLITRSLVPKPVIELLSLLNSLPTSTLNFDSCTFAEVAEGRIWHGKIRSVQCWAKDLAIVLCTELSTNQLFFSILPQLFINRPTSARDLLPLLVQSILSCWEKSEADILRLRHHTLSTHFTLCLGSSLASIETLQAVVDIVLHLRNYHPHFRSDELGYDNWLDLDLLLLSEAALKCESYATALMFLELARNEKKGTPPVDLYDTRVQKIMFDTYSNVEDPDGFYGIKTQDISNALHRRLQHEGEYWRSFGLHSAALNAGSTASTSMSMSLLAMRDLHNLGFHQVSKFISGSVKDVSDTKGNSHGSSEPLLFDLAWRTGDWDLPVPSGINTPESLLYTSLRAVHRESNLAIARDVAREAISLQVGLLRKCGTEKITQIQKIVTDLICLREVEKWLDLNVVGDSAVACDFGRFAYLSSQFPFGDAERLMATRRSLITAAKEREHQTFFGDLVTEKFASLVALETRCLLRLGEMARDEGKIQASINAVVAVQQLKGQSNDLQEAIEDEFGQVLWAQNEHVLAISHLEERMRVLRDERKDGNRLAILLSRAAHWTSKAKLKAPHDINATFEEAIRLSHAHKVSGMEQSHLFQNYAAFADSQQAALSRSPELERLASYVERKGAVLKSASQLPTIKRIAKSSTRADMTDQLQQEIMEDEQAIANILAQKSSYAKVALRSYASALILSDDHDDSTTRMCSLWLEYDEDEDVNNSFRGPLTKVPSHKFIFLSPQLAARLDQPRSLSAFNKALNGLVHRISQQHPFHILYQVITLAEGFLMSSRGKRTSDIGIEGRAPAAAQILTQLSTDTETPLANMAIKQMKILADSATKWCLSRSKEEDSVALGKAIAVPASCPLKSLQNLNIPCPTTPPPLDPLCKYTAIPTLLRYRSTYSVLGGIHRPKRMQVYDSTGQIFRELYKGDDELRQDAVMEQVFEMSNKLLSRDRKTRTRALRFRKYVVIPLARKTGIMEFVGDSQAIGDWLKPAHNRYGKIYADVPADEFRRTLKPIQEKDQEWHKLPKQYSKMMANFHPVMRHFFTEKHRDPMAWFTMRLNYTRSVAVTSIVGWVLGIGDRHCSNILIDQKSGELVHIDFGIVFEDGRRLRIPEKVPFRLTPDIVDGFGLTGVDGTFRRCAEHTLRVLRESSELIMTVLEVFKYDPLYAWDADPEKLQRAQGGGRVTTGTSASALEKADRILSKIKIKLGEDLSVEYTVNQLIQEARDVDNLAKIFVGWQPWF